MIPAEIWMVFLFALGASVGSFLNVVVYRLPLEMSVVKPGSHCPLCKKAIAWYDNIPIFAWLLLRGRCRHCGAGFSIQYPMVELLTALLFVGLYWVYFRADLRGVLPGFEQGGWLVYGGHIVLVCVLLASSLIDAKHWIIPLSVSYLAAVVGVVLSMIWPYWLEVEPGQLWRLVPYATAKSGAAGLGAALGLAAGLIMLKLGLLKRSFAQLDEAHAKLAETTENGPTEDPGDLIDQSGIGINVRREMMLEVGFLSPAVMGGLIFMWILTAGGGESGLSRWWQEIIQQKWLAGLLGSIFGFMIGGGIVWATRILGTLSFGREAMGLGDVHLMAAAGAVLGWVSPTIAFFVAPFFGLGWAVARLALQGSREIPYGPFLSMGTLAVMVFYEPIVNYFINAFTAAGGMAWNG